MMMMDDYKNSDNFQRTEGCKIISPHYSHPTNRVRPSDSNYMNLLELSFFWLNLLKLNFTKTLKQLLWIV